MRERGSGAELTAKRRRRVSDVEDDEDDQSQNRTHGTHGTQRWRVTSQPPRIGTDTRLGSSEEGNRERVLSFLARRGPEHSREETRRPTRQNREESGEQTVANSDDDLIDLTASSPKTWRLGMGG